MGMSFGKILGMIFPWMKKHEKMAGWNQNLYDTNTCDGNPVTTSEVEFETCYEVGG